MKFQVDISNTHTHSHTHTHTHTHTHIYIRTSRNQYVPHFFKVGGIMNKAQDLSLGETGILLEIILKTKTIKPS